MKGRICIPIHNERGELVTYARRWTDEVPLPEGESRYKLPAKFGKSLHRVASPSLVLVDGFWSVFRLHALGIPVVSPMGWAVSAEQVELLCRRGISQLILLMDGDATGRNAVETLLPVLARSFFIRVGELPSGMKPDTIPEEQLLELVCSFPA